MRILRGCQRTRCTNLAVLPPTRARHLRASQVGQLSARAEKEPSSSGPDEDTGDADARLHKAVARFKKDGIDEATARKVLKAWREHDNVSDGDSLRRKVNRTGASAFKRASIQLVFDGMAATVAHSLAQLLDAQPVHGSIVIILYFISYYLAIMTALDLWRIGSVVGGTLSTGGRADELYAALQHMATGSSGIALLDKAEAAVNITKVVFALNSVRIALKDDDAEASKGALSTLRRLQSHFVLEHARAAYNWDADSAGIGHDDAVLAAATFAEFDSNEDNRLEAAEFKALCDQADFELTDAEAAAAVQMLDKRGSGFVEFDEFATWWVTQAGSGMADPFRSLRAA